MSNEKILEIVLRGRPLLFKINSNPKGEIIWHVKPAPKTGEGNYRLHYLVTGFDWRNELNTKAQLLQSLNSGNLILCDYFEGTSKGKGKHPCRCKIMDLMAAGCRCGGV